MKSWSLRAAAASVAVLALSVAAPGRASASPPAAGPIAPPAGLHTDYPAFRDGTRLRTVPTQPLAKRAASVATVPLHVRVLDARGEPFAGGSVTIVDVDDMTYGFYSDVRLDADGAATVDVNPADYAIFAHVYTPAAKSRPETVTITALPELRVDGATDAVLDARGGQPVQVPAPAPHLRVVDAGIFYSRSDAVDQSGWQNGVLPTAEELARGQVLVKESEGVDTGRLEFATHWRMLSAGGDVYDLFLRSPHLTSRQAVHRDDIVRLDATYRPPAEPGTGVEGRWPYSDMYEFGVPIAAREVPLPSRRREWVSAGSDVRWSQCLWAPPAERYPLGFCEREHSYTGHKPQPHDRMLMTHPALAQAYQLTGSDRMYARVGVGEGYGTGLSFPFQATGQRLRLYRDGALLGESTDVGAWFDIPSGPGRYTLESATTWQPGVFGALGDTDTRWTFSSTPPNPNTGFPPAAQWLSVDYRPELDLAGRAPADRLLPIELRPFEDGFVTDAAVAMRSVRVWYATGNDPDWRELELVGAPGGIWRGAIAPGELRRGGSVSLRVEAQDEAGNRFEQTLRPAFLVG